MKNFKRILLTVVSALLLMAVTVAGTLAYLQATTNTVTNTFTVGKVHFGDEEDLADGLDEEIVDLYGDSTNEGRTTTGNQYKLLAGETYTKDPTVTIGEGSEECYVRMIVKIYDLADVKAMCGVADDQLFLPQYFVGGWDDAIWLTQGAKEANNVGTYEFWYHTTVDAREEAQKLEALFTTFTVPTTATNEQIKAVTELSDTNTEVMKIEIVAHAIQSENFADQATAWAAWTNN